MSRYPLGQYESDSITSRTGKKLSEITLEEVKSRIVAMSFCEPRSCS